MKARRSRLGSAARAALLVALVLVAPAYAAEQTPIRIGFGMALTGGLAAAGKSALIAMQIWAEDTNAAGGLLGRPVELVYYDDQSNPAVVPGIYAKLLDIDRVDFIVSGYGTNQIAPALPLAIQRNRIFLALFGIANNEDYGYDRYFQIVPAGPRPREGISKGYFELARAQGLKTVAIISADAEYSQHSAEGGRKNAAENGMRVVYDKSYPLATADFSPIVRAINAVAPDFVFVSSYPVDSSGLVRALNEVGPAATIKMFGGGMVGLQYSSIAESLGPKLNGLVNYDWYVPEKSVMTPAIEAFLAKYRDRAKDAGVDPLGRYLPPWAYAYLELLGQAIARTGSLDDAVLAAYLHENPTMTAVGEIRFGPKGEWEQARSLMVQYKGFTKDNVLEALDTPGARQVIYPDSLATGSWLPYVQGKQSGG